MGKRGIRFIPSSGSRRIMGLTRSEIAVACGNQLFFLNLGFFFFFVILIIIVIIMIVFVMFM